MLALARCGTAPRIDRRWPGAACYHSQKQYVYQRGGIEWSSYIYVIFIFTLEIQAGKASRHHICPAALAVIG